MIKKSDDYYLNLMPTSLKNILEDKDKDENEEDKENNDDDYCSNLMPTSLKNDY